eukprot:2100866-Rhodomonas_salina.1
MRSIIFSLLLPVSYFLIRALHCWLSGYAGCHRMLHVVNSAKSNTRNRNFSSFVPEVRLFVFDFGLYRAARKSGTEMSSCQHAMPPSVPTLQRLRVHPSRC